MGLEEVGGVEWMLVAWGRDMRVAFVNILMNLTVYIEFRGICWFVKELVVFREGFYLLHGVVCFGVIGLVG